MSGYCGMLRTDGVAVQEDFLLRITGNLAFRGPDGSRIQAKEPLGFSFSFLELGPSRQARRQPAPAESSDEELVLLTWTAVCRSFLVIFLSVLWDAEEKSFVAGVTSGVQSCCFMRELRERFASPIPCKPCNACSEFRTNWTTCFCWIFSSRVCLVTRSAASGATFAACPDTSCVSGTALLSSPDFSNYRVKIRCCSKIPTSISLMAHPEPDFAALDARLDCRTTSCKKGGPARNLREPGICVCMET